MNIAIIHDRFPSGGAERISIDIAKYNNDLNNGRYKFFVYCRRQREELVTDELNRLITIRKTRKGKFGRYRDVLRFIREDKIDVVVMPITYMWGMPRIQRLTGVKAIYCNHGVPFWQKEITIIHRKRRYPILWKLILKKLYIEKHWALKKAVHKTRKWYDWCDAYMVLCDDYKRETEHVFKIRPQDSKIVAIENSESIVDPISWKKENIILYCGRVVYDIKRIDRLLRIWGRIDHLLPNWKLQIVGTGKAFTQMKKMVDREHLERVYFEGIQANVHRFYRKASIVCLTSEVEGWGLALTEGQSHGCIPVSFDCSAGVREIIAPNGECGFLVPPYDEEAFARTLLDIANMPEEKRLPIRRAAVARRRLYTRDVIGKKWEALFESIQARP